MWSRLGMSSTCAPGIILPKAAAEPAISSDVPTAISTGTVIAAASSLVISRREPRRHAASARRSERVWSAKARNVRPTGSVTSSSDDASSATDAFTGAAALDQTHPDAAENRRPEPLRLALRQPGRHPPAERIAHDVGALDVQMIHQRADIAGHRTDVILLGIVELGGIAMAAIVERDDAAAVFLQF